MDASSWSLVTSVASLVLGVLASIVAADVHLNRLTRFAKQSIAIRAIATAAALILFSIGITFGLWFLFGSGHWNSESNKALISSTLQTSATILGLALAGGLGVYAIVEHTERHRPPKILLSFSDESMWEHRHEPLISPTLRHVNREIYVREGFTLYVTNSSKVLADNFTIDVCLPQGYRIDVDNGYDIHEPEAGMGDLYEPLLGSSNQWRLVRKIILVAVEGPKRVDSERQLWARFRSDDETFLYPGETQAILRLIGLKNEDIDRITTNDMMTLEYRTWTPNSGLRVATAEVSFMWVNPETGEAEFRLPESLRKRYS